MNTEELLDTRQNSHGDFRDNGAIMQALKDDMRVYGKNWDSLYPYQCEGLDMIQHKIGRILSGDPNWADHWDDIIGYAARVVSIMREDGIANA